MQLPPSPLRTPRGNRALSIELQRSWVDVFSPARRIERRCPARRVAGRSQTCRPHARSRRDREPCSSWIARSRLPRGRPIRRCPSARPRGRTCRARSRVGHLSRLSRSRSLRPYEDASGTESLVRELVWAFVRRAPPRRTPRRRRLQRQERDADRVRVVRADRTREVRGRLRTALVRGLRDRCRTALTHLDQGRRGRSHRSEVPRDRVRRSRAAPSTARSRVDAGRIAASGDQAGRPPSGSAIVKVAPEPGVDATSTVPP